MPGGKGWRPLRDAEEHRKTASRDSAAASGLLQRNEMPKIKGRVLKTKEDAGRLLAVIQYRADTDTEMEIATGMRATQKESAAILKRSRMGNRHRQHIYSAICRNGGMTCDEIEVALDLRHQTASCFVRFLTQDKFLRPRIKANGEQDRRKTRSGRMAIVWEPVPDADREKKPDPQKELFDNKK